MIIMCQRWLDAARIEAICIEPPEDSNVYWNAWAVIYRPNQGETVVSVDPSTRRLLGVGTLHSTLQWAVSLMGSWAATSKEYTDLRTFMDRMFGLLDQVHKNFIDAGAPV